jgi:hypothetical protein
LHRLQVGAAHLMTGGKKASNTGQADTAGSAGDDNRFAAFFWHRYPLRYQLR